MTRLHIICILILALIALLPLSACSDGGDDDSCDSNDDCLVGWGWICVDHKCVKEDGDGDSEVEYGDSDIKPCSIIEDEEECLEDSARCIWENGACTIKPYSPDGDSEYEGDDPGQNGSGCRYLSYSECLNWPQCEWVAGECMAASSGPDCSMYRTESECARGYGCEWNGYACVPIM